MEKKSRREFSAEFNAKVVLLSLKDRQTLEETARKYEIRPNQIGIWRREFLTKAALVFSPDEALAGDKKQQEALIEKPYTQIGQQKMANIPNNYL